MIMKGDASWLWMPEDGKRLDRKQKRLNTELLKAVEEQEETTVLWYLQNGAKPNATCGPLRVTTCHLAAWTGNCDIIQHLLKWGASCRTPDTDGRRPLHLAAWCGNAEFVKTLLTYSPDVVNARTRASPSEDFHVAKEDLDSWNHDHDCLRIRLPTFESGSTALHIACQKLHLECVHALLAAGADVGATDDCGMTPLQVIGENVVGDPLQNTRGVFKEVYEELRKAGAILPQSTSNLRTSPMHTAISLEQIEAIPLILTTPGFVLEKDKSGTTPMHLAVSQHLELPLRTLLQSYNNTTDVLDGSGNTPLQLAVLNQWKDGVGIFLEAGADTCWRNREGATAVHLAAEVGDKDILQEILNVCESKNVLNTPDIFGEPPLFKAVLGKNVKCVKLILNAGARLRQTRPDIMTVLHRAAEVNSHAVMTELLRRDRNSKVPMINQPDSHGFTPLHVACLNGNTECVNVLLTEGCDVNFQTTYEAHTNCNALHLATAEGHSEVVEFLLSRVGNSAFINAKDNHGCTPLHLACQKGQRECIRKLLLSGADLSAKLKKKKTTAMELLFQFIAQPISLLEEILDSHIKINEFPMNDHRCVITVDYRLLAPRAKGNKQMKVLDALFDTGTCLNQESLVLHPVVESFLFLKWRNWRFWFYYSFIVYLAFLLVFSIMIISVYHLKDNGLNVPVWISKPYCKPVVIITLLWLISLEVKSACRLPKYYFTDLESWLKWSSYALAGVVTIQDDPHEDWHRLVSTLGILLSWAELMFQLSRNPNWGYYINMFSKVASNVCKVLVTFIFLLIGFSLAFMVLFNSEAPFDSPYEAFVKVTIMMTTEFEYSTLFRDNTNLAFPIFGRFLFLAFVLMVSIVLMNLLVGLAVSDIAGLETRGKMNRLRKQADFLRIIQPSDGDIRFMPKCIKRMFNGLRSVQPPVEIRPGNPQCKCRTILPGHVVDALIQKASFLRKSVTTSTVQEEILQELKAIKSTVQRMEKIQIPTDGQLLTG